MSDYGVLSLGDIRDAYRAELQNPAVRDRLLAITHAEVGGEGPQAHQAFLETIFNRAAARNQSIGQTLTGPYFPDITYSRADRGVNDAQRAYYAPILDTVSGGSNISNYATGNASGTVGFAGGPQTVKFGGERFGWEGPDIPWVNRVTGGNATLPQISPSQFEGGGNQGTTAQSSPPAPLGAAALGAQGSLGVPLFAPPDSQAQSSNLSSVGNGLLNPPAASFMQLRPRPQVNMAMLQNYLRRPQ